MSRPTAVLVVAVSLGVVSLALILLAVVGPRSPDRPGATQSPQNVTIPRPEETAPAAAVKPVHRALHVLGRVCRPGASTDQASHAQRPVQVILTFARKYPNVSFPLHDETGTTLSLLFVARNEVQSCAPSLTARIERRIPAEYLTPSDAAGEGR